ncbi:multidrug effflux MFS transporter [Pseudaminobacter sp. 19-2017]|uniref:Bcr/CflA family efflux transporter n=1 Tax=Pseudaminobacter soli (ex Zhang et al. 2022) TaxID=2831468 RepID=A0A942DZP3_9HYPH|nr:multidrug effflux MFS transporter [Pseudaminobacter soli]MBS3647910.1 multidrug effflux MFS transporter [Pseudaminobacter soli]
MNVQSRPAARPVMSERRVSLLGGLLVAIGPVSMALYTPAMPEIVHAFGTTEAAVKLTLSVYFAGFALAQLVCGPLSDGLGRKPVTYGFLAIYLVASLLAMIAPNVHVLIVARLLQGVGAAVGWAIARAIVRDLFTHERSARIMNLIGLILAVGPAVSPTLGGLTMELAGWHAIFVLMFVAALGIILAVRLIMVETVQRDISRIRPRALIGSYRQVLASPYFVLSSLVLSGSVGALYTQATVLPFILMDRVGFTPSQFGAGMLMQSGMYFAGSLAVRQLLGRFGAFRLVPVGLAFIGLGSVAVAVTLRVYEPCFLGVMGPVALFSFGIAFVIPATATATLAPFPHIAGAASSMSGFFQMGGGLLGGLICAAMGDPVVAMATVIPAMGLLAILSWALWTRLPTPKAASVVQAPPVSSPSE